MNRHFTRRLALSVVGLMLPFSAFAQTLSTADLQRMIASLQAQIASLQAQLNNTQNNPQQCYVFRQNLRVGDGGTGADTRKDQDIAALIKVLAKEGLLEYDATVQPGTAGTSLKATYFSENVASAVVAFQEKYADEILTPNGLKRGSGFVGASTRAKLNQLSCGDTPVRPPENTTMLIPSTTKGDAPLYVRFTANVPTDTGSLRFFIDFGDGQTSTLSRLGPCPTEGVTCTLPLGATHLYTKSGIYSASLMRDDCTTACKGNGTVVSRATITVTDSKGTNISVISPNGGESWIVGETYQIRFAVNASQLTIGTLPSEYLVYLDKGYPSESTKKGVNSSFLIGRVKTDGEGVLQYTVPSSLVTWPGLGANYKIRVCEATACTTGDSSNADFAIGQGTGGSTVKAPVITSTSAKAAGNFEIDAGGEAFIVGTDLAGDDLNTVRVYIGGIQASVLAGNDTSLSIAVPSALTAGRSYNLYLANSRGSSNVVSVKVLSNVLTTGDAPSCTLSGDKLAYTWGDVIKLSWTSRNATYGAFLQDTSGKDTLWVPGDKLDTSGSATITANVLGNPTVTLLVYGNGGKGSCSIMLPISQTNTGISVISPNGGEQFNRGSTYGGSFSWNGFVPKDVHVYLYNTVSAQAQLASLGAVGAGSSAGDKSFSFTIPESAVPGSNYKILVCDDGNYSAISGKPICDISDNYVTVVSPTAPVTYEGQIFKKGETWNLRVPTIPGASVYLMNFWKEGDSGSFWENNREDHRWSYDGTYAFTPENPKYGEAPCNQNMRFESRGYTPNGWTDSRWVTVRVTCVDQVSPITVISPSGGENLLVGSNFEIRWGGGQNANGTYNGVDIRLIPRYCDPSGSCVPTTEVYHTITAGALRSSSYPWVVGHAASNTNYPNGYTVPEGSYYIQVCSSGTSVCDISDAPFTISSPATNPSITVTYPNGGEQLLMASTKDVDFRVTWISKNLSGTAYVYLHFTDGGTCLLGSTPVSQGYFPVTLTRDYQCSNIPSRVVPGQYKILLATDTTSPNGGVRGVSDTSDGYFTLSLPTAPASITVVSPNGGEVFTAGGTYGIQWRSQGVTSYTLSICVGPTDTVTGGLACSPIRSSLSATSYDGTGAGSGMYWWPISTAASYVPGNTLKIRIADATNPNIYDDSDAFFAITRGDTSSSVFIVNQNMSVTDQTVSPGSTNVLMTALTLDGTRLSESVSLSAIPFILSGTGNPAALQNCRLYDGSISLVSGAGLVNPGQFGEYAFTLTAPNIVAPGIKKKIDVRCDIGLTARGTYRWGVLNPPTPVTVTSGQKVDVSFNTFPGPVVSISGGVTLTPIGTKLVNQGQELSFAVTASTPSGEALSWTLLGTAFGSKLLPIGDVSLNGAISSLDASYIQQYVAGTKALTEGQKLLADVNQDGSITVADAERVLQMAVGTAQPVQTKRVFVWDTASTSPATYNATVTVRGVTSASIATETFPIVVGPRTVVQASPTNLSALASSITALQEMIDRLRKAYGY